MQAFLMIWILLISIHAPTRGATRSCPVYLVDDVYFNPRSHEGSDTTLIVLLLSSKGFQSTLPRGERP